MAKDEVFVKLDNYVKAANELAESVKRDLRDNKGKVTKDTVLALSNYQKANEAAANLLQIFDGTGEH
jgi:hypothetical protein